MSIEHVDLEIERRSRDFLYRIHGHGKRMRYLSAMSALVARAAEETAFGTVTQPPDSHITAEELRAKILAMLPPLPRAPRLFDPYPPVQERRCGSLSSCMNIALQEWKKPEKVC